MAVHHQHFFNFRLDLDVDGTNNSVLEMNTAALPAGPSNPFLNAFSMTETIFQNERQAVRELDMAASRRWTVFNPNVKNSLGYPTGYTLLPGENSVAYAAPESWLRRRANFIDAHFWATPFDPQQPEQDHRQGNHPERPENTCREHLPLAPCRKKQEKWTGIQF